MLLTRITVKPPIKDIPKEDKPPNKGQAESTRVYTLYIEITSERGQPLYKGQNGWSQGCSSLRGSTVVVEINTGEKDKNSQVMTR